MRSRPTLWTFSCLVAALVLVAQPVRAEDKLIAHEWGTFTTLQNESGEELTGINIDDEPVPSFVHNLSRFVLQPTFLTNRHWIRRMKGAPRHHPRVTMRLETPVIYFYRPSGGKQPSEIDVRVKFRGGWLTEFFPAAAAKAPGIRDNFVFADLQPTTVSSLEWKDLRVGVRGKFPATKDHVWTTPRAVDSEPISTAKGESEQYVFYRGVANLRSPLRVTAGEDESSLELRANFGDVKCGKGTRVPAMWLVDVRADGKLAFREFDGVNVTSDEETLLATLDARFGEEDYHAFNLKVLKKLMWIAIRDDGLYPDEATAMLETWNRAYFESPGRRLFFVVPREWTDHYLPIEIESAAEVERVMIGRIELVTSEQRRLLREIATAPAPDASWVRKIPRTKARERFLAGRMDFGDLGVEIPAHYQRYLGLGRFRNALIVEEERVRPTTALSAFIDSYGLRPYAPKNRKRPQAEKPRAD